MARIIDVIDHTNVGDNELAWREPQQGSGDWRMGSQVIVGESQAAVFVRGGQALDALGPGRHTLSTANLPILSSIIGMATSGRTPFTADLYFINLKDLPQVGWGTNPPIVLETPGYGRGVALLITHGVIDIGIQDAMMFTKQYAVGKASVSLNDIKERIQATLLGEIAQLISNSGAKSIMDANKLLDQLEGAALVQLNDKFAAMGMRIKAFESKPFTAKNATLDEISNYVSAEALERIERMERLNIARDAANNPGIAGTAAGAGLGFGVGQQIGQTMGNNQPDANTQALQQQLQQQQLMMQQMMMQMMQNQNQGQQAAAAPQIAPAAASSNPTTKAEVQKILDDLDMKLMNGEVSEAVYNRMYQKWESRMAELP
ncbi:MAG: SPFH domain-containing protein [Phototrophicaceae bacterium]|jgi:membrane protease subunit (stomatin/prohibitin family)